MRIDEIILSEGINDPGIFKAVFVVGPPGAGKNTIIKQLGLTAAGLKLQDIDETLAYLRRMKTEKVDYEASLSTTLRRQAVLQREMLGLIINATGRDYDSIMRLNQHLKQAGYDTFMIFVDVDEDVAVRRVTTRPTTSTSRADIGRKVDIETYFHDAYSSVKNNAPLYAALFGDQIAIVINNEDRGPQSRHLPNPTLNFAEKKLRQFLNKPLSPTAQNIIAAKRPRQHA